MTLGLLGCTTAHLDAALRLQGCGLGLLGHSTGLAGTWYWDCWDVALGLMGCSPGIAGTWHWVYQDVVLGLLGHGAGIWWDVWYRTHWDTALGLLGFHTGIVGTQHWDCGDLALGLLRSSTGITGAHLGFPNPFPKGAEDSSAAASQLFSMKPLERARNRGCLSPCRAAGALALDKGKKGEQQRNSMLWSRECRCLCNAP